MKNIQEELINHLETNHTEIIEACDPDNFDFDDDYHQELHDLCAVTVTLLSCLSLTVTCGSFSNK